MNVEIGAEAAQFPEKEYINGIAVAVYSSHEQKSYFWLLAHFRQYIVPTANIVQPNLLRYNVL
jgi:hypothetical protein